MATMAITTRRIRIRRLGAGLGVAVDKVVGLWVRIKGRWELGIVGRIAPFYIIPLYPLPLGYL